MRRLLALAAMGLLALAPVAAQAARAVPCDYLTAPVTISHLLDVGDRPVWSPDGTRIAYAADFTGAGEAYELDLTTGQVRCLTCALAHLGFFRVHYLPDGSFLLIGRTRSLQAELDRLTAQELFWLPATLEGPAQALGIGPFFEGIAVSQRSNRIGWSTSPAEGQTPQVVTGTVRVRRGVARVIDVSSVPAPTVVEVQDFFPDRNEILATAIAPDFEVIGVDLDTGAVRNYSQRLGYEEAEGMSRDGRFDFMESDRDTGTHLEGLDVYALALDGTGQRVRRITHEAMTVPTDESLQAHQPTISPDGRRLAYAVRAGLLEERGLRMATFEC